MDELKVGGAEKKSKINWLRVCVWVFVVIYLLSPADIIPEVIFGPLGYADDSLLVILKIVEEVYNRRKKAG